MYQGYPDGTASPADEQSIDAIVANDWQGVRAWRKRERERLIARRVSLTEQEKNQVGATIIRTLRKEFQFNNVDLGFYWPLPGEIDLRPWITDLLVDNVKVALPAIVKRDQPLEFWEWNPQMKLKTCGMWGLPTPPLRKVVSPKILLVPLLGFDRERNRLGHGGGYYDRTLAELTPVPVTIGIGYEFGGFATIYPQDHDVPMDFIVTERGMF